MISYKMDLTDVKRKKAIEIALESQGNIRKRKRIIPICCILAILEIAIGLYLCVKGAYVSGISILILGFFILCLAFKAKEFQRFVLMKTEKLIDASVREGIVEYVFDNDGIKIKSQMGCGENYWNAFKEYGHFGEYIYVKRKDNKIILVDKNDLTSSEIDELLSLFSNNIHR